jgi:dephospho-CoA kinase
MLIGLTGLSCAGKNYIGSLLEADGYPLFDLDKIGHEALNNKKDIVAAVFGAAVITDSGSVDRRALGKIVFNDAEQRCALEKIIHPEVDQLLAQRLKEKYDKPVVLNAALLHKSRYFTELSALIMVRAPYLARLFRGMRRDHLPLHAVVRRMASQKDFMAQYQKSIKNLHQAVDIYFIDNGIFVPKDFAQQLHTLMRCIVDKDKV